MDVRDGVKARGLLLLGLLGVWAVSAPAWAQAPASEEGASGEEAASGEASDGAADAAEGDSAEAASEDAGEAVSDDVSDDAEDAEDPRFAEARERFRQGVELAREGNCEGALAELRASLRLVERPNTLFNMARCHEELFRYDLAVETYERYLEIAPEDAEDRAAVEATMRSLRNLLGTIVVASNVPAEVWIGERVVGEAPGEVLVPGGRHALELRAEGYVPTRREVEVAGRERVEVRLELEQAQVNVTNVENTTVEVTEEGGAPPAVFYTGVALTAAAALVGAAFGGRALALRGETEDLPPLDRERIEAGNAETADAALLADVFFGVAGAFAVTTLVLFFLTDFDGDADERAEADAEAASWRPVGGPGQLG
ncbi:MAG TPA: PEGA domain-containing protein, partial [Polyangiaceae bacterium LLY-WYZ-15_(1-7)]|nr:PEGA domain-containing protein [Polyangiaceae bacterium LLY-WYZ-15_(1-7)]